MFFCVSLLPENEEAFVPHPTQCSCLLRTGTYMSLCASFLVFHCIVVMVFVIFLRHLDVVVFHFLSLRLFSCHYLRNLFGTGKCRICTSCKIKMINVYSFVIFFVIFLGQVNVVFLLVEILKLIDRVFLYISLLLYSWSS